ncbi:SDR family oxidoreductase [Microbacterium sp. p3-SID338]|uniref:SDR family oxidoreductase n=1 Tax=unclassified Microbacterium TaxID=2609290 RepID=UPI000C801CB2|nr:MULTISPECIES: SDR family oxidoreductase [unclassified Microbacterium]MCT1397148.1 SDR family oxidoreductase [Microbacterium sp. p3-SID338]PMC05130.1 2-deoxy-D-gluconate 3-dehydrogenase [Microbacterium sp. UMB0228]
MSAASFRLDGRTAVVTGASRGIGAAVAEALLHAGAHVVTMQRGLPAHRLPHVAEESGSSLTSVSVDLASTTSIARAIEDVRADHEVDILVNNAGIQARHDAVEFPLDEFTALLDVNTRAAFQLAQGFGADMLRRRYGKIVNMASLLSFQGGLRVAAYAASKGAVAQLTKALCNEWAARGVNVNAVAPGYIGTDMNEALISDDARNAQILERIPAGRWGAPEDIAGAVVFLSSDAAAYVHGTVLPVDGGWLAR